MENRPHDTYEHTFFTDNEVCLSYASVLVLPEIEHAKRLDIPDVGLCICSVKETSGLTPSFRVAPYERVKLPIHLGCQFVQHFLLFFIHSDLLFQYALSPPARLGHTLQVGRCVRRERRRAGDEKALCGATLSRV